MRLIARCPTKTDLERTFLDSTIGCLRQNHLNQTLTKPFYACSQFSYHKSATTHLKSVCQQLPEINRGTDKTIHNQPGTTFPHLIRKKYQQITPSISITLAFST